MALMLVGVGCSGDGDPVAEESGEAVEVYEVRGTVVRLVPEDTVVVLDHEEIEGWMKGMTMEFPVQEEEFGKLSDGDRIEAKVNVKGLDYWLTDIRVAPPEGGDPEPQ